MSYFLVSLKLRRGELLTGKSYRATYSLPQSSAMHCINVISKRTVFIFCLYTILVKERNIINEKSAQRDVNTARAGCSKVRTPPARPLATNTQTHRQDRLQYTAPLASAQCNKTEWTLIVYTYSNAIRGCNTHWLRQQRELYVVYNVTCEAYAATQNQNTVCLLFGNF